ncbi:hypothetical protein L596_007773 [Steinernema carpocapsae]|uniref:Uncharacterized protein n=1 Tax=Steinernema carpocapsae TaxID=34508 RepID=A0A4U5PAD9_STECR|nr:hypothetical protein L596_007773 [Steinernema carpocapsae]
MGKKATIHNFRGVWFLGIVDIEIGLRIVNCELWILKSICGIVIVERKYIEIGFRVVIVNCTTIVPGL